MTWVSPVSLVVISRRWCFFINGECL